MGFDIGAALIGDLFFSGAGEAAAGGSQGLIAESRQEFGRTRIPWIREQQGPWSPVQGQETGRLIGRSGHPAMLSRLVPGRPCI